MSKLYPERLNMDFNKTDENVKILSAYDQVLREERDSKLLEKNEYAGMKEILSNSSIIAIKGSIAIASSILTKEAEKKFFNAKSFKDKEDNYIVDYKLYQQITKLNKEVLKKWHSDNDLPYYGK